MKLTYATYSCIGGREINEDAVELRQEEDCLVVVVADGLGGHDKGEVASAVVAKTIAEEMPLVKKQNVETLITVMQQAQNRLLQVQKEESSVNAMKTTAVTLVTDAKYAYLAHVGDSRAYAFRKLLGYKRTLDHSVPQMMVCSGQMEEKEIRNHPDRNSLLRVFGIPWEKEMIEVMRPMKLRWIQAFLLCTDGFWELIEETQMQQCLKRARTPKEWLEAMADIVKMNGKDKEMDNYTAAAVFMGR